MPVSAISASFKYVPPNRSETRHSGPGFKLTGVTNPESSRVPLDFRFHGDDEVKNGFMVVLN